MRTFRSYAPSEPPGDVIAGLLLEHLGKFSVTYRIGLFQDGDDVAAVGRFVHVYVDARTRRPAEVPSQLHSCLHALSPGARLQP